MNDPKAVCAKILVAQTACVFRLALCKAMADDDYDYVKAALTAPLPTIAAAAVQALEEKE